MSTKFTPTEQQYEENSCQYPVDPKYTQQYSYPDRLRKFTPDVEPLKSMIV